VSLRASVGLELPLLASSRARAETVDLAAGRWTSTGDGRRDVTVWATGASGDRATFEDGLDADGSVSRWLCLSRGPDRSLYRVRLTADASARVDPVGWTDGRAVLGPARPTGTEWVLEGFFPDRSVLRRFEAWSEASGVPFSLRRVTETEEPFADRRYGLTALQADSLRFALDHGYFEVPRQTTLEGLASTLDVSHQALSERVRRGVGALVDTTLGDDSPSADAGVRRGPGDVLDVDARPAGGPPVER
jgi:hypothetical protein